jgi:protein-tyrosine phosphatase
MVRKDGVGQIIVPNSELDTINEIVDGVYVSSVLGALSFKGLRICVHHDTYLVYDYHMPILLTRPDEKDRNKQAIVNHKQLDLLADIINNHIIDREPLMIHCKGGVERSPLTLVHYLMKWKGYDIDKAYDFVKSRRPVTIDRRAWLYNG